MTILPEQCRAARALIGWSRDQLAEAARVALRTVVDFERGARRPYDRTLLDIRQALEKGGVIFLDGNGDGPGVRLRKSGG
jgi:transcriptional regulator with XRE-family HTH domain